MITVTKYDIRVKKVKQITKAYYLHQFITREMISKSAKLDHIHIPGVFPSIIKKILMNVDVDVKCGEEYITIPVRSTDDYVNKVLTDIKEKMEKGFESTEEKVKEEDRENITDQKIVEDLAKEENIEEHVEEEPEDNVTIDTGIDEKTLKENSPEHIDDIETLDETASDAVQVTNGTKPNHNNNNRRNNNYRNGTRR